MPVKESLKIVAFENGKEWEKWLAKNHRIEDGVWLRFFKKASGVPTLTYAEALDGALCYGWIDGQVKKYDEKSWLQRFTPRRARSLWSKKNIENVSRLTKLGKMKANGKKEVKAAKADGRWDRAYDSPSSAEVPKDFLKTLSKYKTAEKFFSTLNRSNIYAIVWRLQTAKTPETRARRLEAILEMLKAKKKFHK